MSLNLVTWNVQWATPRSRRRTEILTRIDQARPELVCLTETHIGLLSQEGHTICSQPDYGYRLREGRRKVMLWSREPWEQVDDAGHHSMPPGRFVSGVTQTSLGHVTVVGVCIPWSRSRAEASRGSERRDPWEDHAQYLAGLADVLGRAPTERLIVMGDFNQMVGPRSRAPLELRSALQKTFPPGMRIATSDLAFEGRRSIDHVAVSDDLAVESLDVITNMHDGTRLSDHFGIVAELSARHAARRSSAPTEGKGLTDSAPRQPRAVSRRCARAATISASSAVERRCARAVPPSRRTGSASASGSRRPGSRRRCRRRPRGLTPQHRAGVAAACPMRGASCE